MRTEDIWPRNRAHRYRLYLLRTIPEGERDTSEANVLVAEAKIIAAAPTLEGIGVAFGILLGEDELGPEDRVGVLDTDEEEGTWIVNPYA